MWESDLWVFYLFILFLVFYVIGFFIDHESEIKIYHDDDYFVPIVCSFCFCFCCFLCLVFG